MQDASRYALAACFGRANANRVSMGMGSGSDGHGERNRETNVTALPSSTTAPPA